MREESNHPLRDAVIVFGAVVICFVFVLPFDLGPWADGAVTLLGFAIGGFLAVEAELRATTKGPPEAGTSSGPH